MSNRYKIVNKFYKPSALNCEMVLNLTSFQVNIVHVCQHFGHFKIIQSKISVIKVKKLSIYYCTVICCIYFVT